MAYFSTAHGHCESAFALPQRLRRKNLNILLDKSGWSRDSRGRLHAQYAEVALRREERIEQRLRFVIRDFDVFAADKGGGVHRFLTEIGRHLDALFNFSERQISKLGAAEFEDERNDGLEFQELLMDEVVAAARSA